jgi:lysophospholipase L1-like esterase
MKARLLALGDSISCGEGVGISVDPPDTWVGLLSRAMDADLEVLAVPGVRSGEVREAQLPSAVATPATLATVLVGLNDMVGTPFDSALVYENVCAIVTGLRATGTPVMVSRLHDPTAQLPTPRWVRRRLLERIDVINAAVDSTRGPGVMVLDLARIPGLQTRAGWALDRVHPGVAGHRAMAAAAVALLLEHGFEVRPSRPVPMPRAHSRFAELRWFARHGAPYLARKAGQQHWRDTA